MGVAEVVQPEAGNSGGGDQSVEQLGEAVGVDRLAGRSGEDPVVAQDGPTRLLLPALQPGTDHLDGDRVKVYRPA